MGNKSQHHLSLLTVGWPPPPRGAWRGAETGGMVGQAHLLGHLSLLACSFGGPLSTPADVCPLTTRSL